MPTERSDFENADWGGGLPEEHGFALGPMVSSRRKVEEHVQSQRQSSFGRRRQFSVDRPSSRRSRTTHYSHSCTSSSLRAEITPPQRNPVGDTVASVSVELMRSEVAIASYVTRCSVSTALQSAVAGVSPHIFSASAAAVAVDAMTAMRAACGRP